MTLLCATPGLQLLYDALARPGVFTPSRRPFLRVAGWASLTLAAGYAAIGLLVVRRLGSDRRRNAAARDRQAAAIVAHGAPSRPDR